MKKIAIFVEGQTEQLFINKLLKEIAGDKNIAITLYQLRGGTKAAKQEIFIPQPIANPATPKYEALIYDCGNDNKVKSDILENLTGLASKGYSEIIGIRDLFPLTLAELSRLETGLQFIPPALVPLPIPFEIIVAVYEVEAWFLAEFKHYSIIDPKLTIAYIAANLGFDPSIDDMTLRTNPAKDLNDIYQLAGKYYKKKKSDIQRTVSCLDYHNLYFHLPARIQKLGELINKINLFLS